MAKYGKKASEKVGAAMHEFKKGALKTGTGKQVKSRTQAVAIGLSEAREEGGKVPSASKGSSSKSSSDQRRSGKNTARKKKS